MSKKGENNINQSTNPASSKDKETEQQNNMSKRTGSSGGGGGGDPTPLPSSSSTGAVDGNKKRDEPIEGGGASGGTGETSGNGGGGGVETAEVINWNPLSILAPHMSLLSSLCGVATFLVLYFALIVAGNKEMFFTGSLSSAQLAVFIAGTMLIMLWIGFKGLVYYRVYFAAQTPSEADIVLVSRSYFSDEAQNAISAAAEFSVHMFVFYLCDRTLIVPRVGKKYDKDTFWTLWALLTAAALATLRRAKAPVKKSTAAPAATTAVAVGGEGTKTLPENPTTLSGPTSEQQSASAVTSATEGGIAANKDSSGGGVVSIPEASTAAPATATTTNNSNLESDLIPIDPERYHIKLLQRDQTEEWKGWMQVMFLWYHYFNAKDLYNAIRLYIAAYVWMTGFGNFSYYYIRRDFSFGRFCQMQWRLNFLVFFTCAILQNEYMLYYICMLHTTFTVMIYAGLGIKSSMNYTTTGVVIKFSVLVAISFFVWDISSGVFNVVWSPLAFLVNYHDPYSPNRAPMQEWEFRSFLDHYVWIFGMICAFNHPRLDSWLQRLDNAFTRRTSLLIKTSVVSACLVAGYVYYQSIFSLPKKQYNAIHPYTSFIPLTLYVILRNISNRFRQWHMHLFEYLGKITLETYIAQFHIWMATTGVNGAPKKLLRVLPQGWPLMNFLVLSAFYFWVSFRLFDNTNVLKSWVLPSKVSNAILQRNVVFAGLAVLVFYLQGCMLKMIVNKYSL